MKWFKHQSGAGDSPRMRRLKSRYGAAGYGLYWFLVEQIGIGWEVHGADLNPSLELEDIEDELRIDSGQATDMIRWMISKGLFEESATGLVRCESLRNHVGEAQRKAERRETAKLNSGQAPDTVRTPSGPTPEKEERREEEKRGEKKREEKNTVHPQAAAPRVPFADFWSIWHYKRGKADAEKAWNTAKPSPETFARIKTDLADRLTRDPMWARGVFMLPATYIRGKRWEDEQPAPTNGNGTHTPPAPAKPKRKDDIQLWLEERARIEAEHEEELRLAAEKETAQ